MLNYLLLLQIVNNTQKMIIYVNHIILNAVMQHDMETVFHSAW